MGRSPIKQNFTYELRRELDGYCSNLESRLPRNATRYDEEDVSRLIHMRVKGTFAQLADYARDLEIHIRQRDSDEAWSWGYRVGAKETMKRFSDLVEEMRKDILDD